MAESAQAFQRRACNDPLPADRCVSDETVLVQYSADRNEFRNKPRIDREASVSVLMADGWTLAKVSEYVRRSPPTAAVLAKAGIRRTTAGRLRRTGFAVVHTPGAIADGPHVSVVWPQDRPLEVQVPAWPSEVSQAFDSCFNGKEEL